MNDSKTHQISKPSNAHASELMPIVALMARQVAKELADMPAPANDNIMPPLGDDCSD